MTTWFQFVSTWFRNTVMPLLERIANLEIPISDTQTIHIYTLEIVALAISVFCILVFNDDSD